jgi:fucose 4-O-acetylase-like acetyltransferase
VLAGFAAVAVLSGVAPASVAEAQPLHIIHYGVVFATGVQLPAVVRWFAWGGHVLRTAGVALAVFVGALVWQLTQIGVVAETSARLVRDVAAVALAVTACALLCRLPRLTRPLAAVGRQTLPIYILQLPAIWLLYLLPVTEELHRSEPAWFIGPIIGTAVVVALSLACYAVMQRTVLRNLFRLPSAWSDRLVTPGRRRGAPSGRSSCP